MFNITPFVEVKPLNPKAKRPRGKTYAGLEETMMKIKRAQLMRDPEALVATILVWAEVSKDLLERVKKLEGA